MQMVVDKLVAWESGREMEFNVNKCEVVHQMNYSWVKSIDEEQNLGVLISKDLKL